MCATTTQYTWRSVYKRASVLRQTTQHRTSTSCCRQYLIWSGTWMKRGTRLLSLLSSSLPRHSYGPTTTIQLEGNRVWWLAGWLVDRRKIKKAHRFQHKRVSRSGIETEKKYYWTNWNCLLYIISVYFVVIIIIIVSIDKLVYIFSCAALKHFIIGCLVSSQRLLQPQWKEVNIEQKYKVWESYNRKQ